MKIGILTFQKTTNYGALLQAMAMNKAFLRLDVEVELIDYECEQIRKRELPKSLRGISITRIPIEVICNILCAIKLIKFEKFKKKNCSISSGKYTRKTIQQTNNIYDVFVSGSDMIWELDVTGKDTTFYLDFVDDNRKKFSCSTSFGYDSIPDDYIDTTKSLLADYRLISVRELEGVNIIRTLLGIDVSMTVDPTLLLSDYEWRKYEKPYKGLEKYVLVYFDDPNSILMKSALEYAKRNDCKVLFVSNTLRGISGVKIIRTAGIEQFLWLIDNAECVFTASYHGVLFSVIFNRPFYFFNRAHNGRIQTIVKQLELEKRNIDYIDNNESIDWSNVNSKLEELKDKTIDYMKNIVENND